MFVDASRGSAAFGHKHEIPSSRLEDASHSFDEINTHSPMAVPVATPQSAASLTHQRRGEASIVSRMPKASGRNLVHGSDAAVMSCPEGVLVVAGDDCCETATSPATWLLVSSLGLVSLLGGPIVSGTESPPLDQNGIAKEAAHRRSV